jgi:hypothetical protein
MPLLFRTMMLERRQERTKALVLLAAAAITACNSDSLPSEPANNIHRAEFKCDVELSTRLKLSADADFAYSDAHGINGSYLIVGSFKDGAKRGRFSCDMQYLGGDHWKVTGLRTFWPRTKDSVQVLVK